MSIFVGIPPFSNPLWVAMETMHFHIAHTNIFRTPSFSIQGVPMNNYAPMKNCPWVRGNLNWMPGSSLRLRFEFMYTSLNDWPISVDCVIRAVLIRVHFTYRL